MTKRDRLNDSSMLQRRISAKTMKIDVNQGSARRGLTVVDPKKHSGRSHVEKLPRAPIPGDQSWVWQGPLFSPHRYGLIRGE